MPNAYATNRDEGTGFIYVEVRVASCLIAARLSGWMNAEISAR
jgi:hypothetical protein